MRSTIEQHLQRSRAVQRRVAWLGALGALVTLTCFVADAPGMIVFAGVAVTAIVAAAGLWITQSHIDDFERRLRCRTRSPANGELRPAVPRDRSSAP